MKRREYREDPLVLNSDGANLSVLLSIWDPWSPHWNLSLPPLSGNLTAVLGSLHSQYKLTHTISLEAETAHISHPYPWPIRKAKQIRSGIRLTRDFSQYPPPPQLPVNPILLPIAECWKSPWSPPIPEPQHSHPPACWAAPYITTVGRGARDTSQIPTQLPPANGPSLQDNSGALQHQLK